MKRRFRLTQSTDFKRVRFSGKSYAHPLVVLVTLPVKDEKLRVGVSASRSLGGAIERNRAKRLLREAIRQLIPVLPTGWNLILIARNPLLNAAFPDIQTAIQGLLRKAGLTGN